MPKTGAVLESIWLIDSIISYKFSSENDSIYYSKIIKGWDNYGNWISYTTLNWDSENDVWQGSITAKMFYDTLNRRINNVWNWWDPDKEEWQYYDSSAYSYSIDSLGNLVRTGTNYKFNLYDSIWVPAAKYLYLIDSLGNEYETNSFRYNSADSLFYNESKYEYTFNNSGKVLSKINYRWDLETEEWNNSVKRIFSYDSVGNKLSSIKYTWINDEWLFFSSDYSEYDSLSRSTYLEIFHGGPQDIYKFAFKYEISYDDQFNTKTSIQYELDYSDSTWTKRGKTEYFKDGYDNVTHSVSYSWDATAEDWLINGKIYNYYRSIASLSVSEKELTLAADENSSASFDIKSNFYWNVVSGQEWLTVSKKEGSGDGTVTVTAATNNESGMVRSAKISVIVEGFDTVFVNVTQDYVKDTDVPLIKTGKTQIFPSVVHDGITIKGLSGRSTVEILDLNGRVVISRVLFDEGDYISLKTLPEGMYFVKAVGESTVIKRIVKK